MTYVLCTACNGSGTGPMHGTMSNCWQCGGAGGYRARNERGQFIKVIPDVLCGKNVNRAHGTGAPCVLDAGHPGRCNWRLTTPETKWEMQL